MVEIFGDVFQKTLGKTFYCVTVSDRVLGGIFGGVLRECFNVGKTKEIDETDDNVEVFINV